MNNIHGVDAARIDPHQIQPARCRLTVPGRWSLLAPRDAGDRVEQRTQETEDPSLGGDAAATVPTSRLSRDAPSQPTRHSGLGQRRPPPARFRGPSDLRDLARGGLRCGPGGWSTCSTPPARGWPLGIQPRLSSDPDWHDPPFALAAQAFLLAERWWQVATTELRGVTAQHERRPAFIARQWLDMFSPVTYHWSNPEVMRATRAELGANFARGLCHWLDDFGALLTKRRVPAGEFVVGKDVCGHARRRRLPQRAHGAEFQYRPVAEQVRPEPILIVPAWIMKYYILNFAPENSLGRYLVSAGHTVFMVSWKNPDASYRDVGLDDYRRLGVVAALNAIQAIVPGRRVHACGYCLGGTILAIAATTLARQGPKSCWSQHGARPEQVHRGHVKACGASRPPSRPSPHLEQSPIVGSPCRRGLVRRGWLRHRQSIGVWGLRCEARCHADGEPGA